MEVGNKHLCLDLFFRYCELLEITPGDVFSDNANNYEDKIALEIGHEVLKIFNQVLPFVFSQQSGIDILDIRNQLIKLMIKQKKYHVMETENEFTIIQENLKDMQELLSEFHGFMKDLDYKPIDESISLDSSMVTMLLNISQTTLYRWRDRNEIPYTILSSGACSYRFDEVYLAVKCGRLRARNFDRIEALRTLTVYRDGVIRESGFQPNDDVQ